MTLVSVIMNCCNGEEFLREALDSVVDQTYTNWEIVFWDNASNDNSADIAKSYGDKLRYFRNDRKVSLGEARNQAFNKAKGDFIAILDVDDIWLPNKLKLQLPLFNDPDVALTFTNAVSFDSNGEYNKAFKGCPTQSKEIFKDLLRHNFIWTVTMMFRRSALDNLSYLFDPEFTIICDYDLTLRLAYNYKSDYLQDCLAKWRMGSTKESDFKGFLSARESIILLSKLEINFPTLRDEVPYEIQKFETHTFRRLGKEAWLNGDKQAARDFLRKHRHHEWISFVGYLGTWLFPFRYSKNCVELAQRVRNRFRNFLNG